MAFTQADLDHIDELIALAVTETEEADGKRARFDAYDGLIKRRAFIEKKLASQTRPTSARIQFEPDGAGVSTGDVEGAY